jgi:hypothetical protein
MTKKHKVVVDVKTGKIGCSECNLWEDILEDEKPFGRPMKWLSKHLKQHNSMEIVIVVPNAVET